MLSERSLLIACGGGFKTTEKHLRGSGTNLFEAPSAATAAAAAFLYLEKVKRDKLSPNVITTTKEASTSSEIQISSLKGTTMESPALSNNDNNNNKEINSSSSNFADSLLINHVRNALSGSDISFTMSHMGNQPQSQQHQHQLHSTSPKSKSTQNQSQPNILSCSSNMKKERRSPSTNGDLHSNMSRSRSTTPLSFRGTSPQQTSTETLIPLTSLLRIQQATTADHQNPSAISAAMDTSNLANSAATDYTKRNYSDIMRSLAAKYNDSNPINPAPTRRNQFFDAPLSTQTTSLANKNKTQHNVTRSTATTTQSTSVSQTNSQSNIIPRLSMSPGEVAVAAAAASFLSSLPFSQSVCPPLIDMSSTQALVTLARAAKEAEIHTILRSSQQNSKPLNPSPSSPHPSLGVALQQAAQFVSPALIYAAQIQKQQQESKKLNQSSPLHTGKLLSIHGPSGSDSTIKSAVPTNTITIPLDLSSQPPVKRLKIESYDTGSSRGLDDSKIYVKQANTSLQISENKEFVSSRSNTPEKTSNITLTTSPMPLHNSSVIRQCQIQCEEITEWSVDDVCNFVGEIDICAEYVQHFRDQCIDGSGLPLLTEDHLLNSLGMKLGPALKLRSLLAKKLGGPCPCVACISQTRQMLSFQAAAKGGTVIPVATTSTERPTAPGSTDEDNSDTITITNICNKAMKAHDERREFEQKVIETQQSSNTENGNNCAALTLQICANIFNNEANNNNHINEKPNKDNKRGLAKLSNKSCNSSIDCVINPTNNSLKSEDCKNNNSAGDSNSAKNVNFQRTRSGDIADVGS
ncbi:serine-rich adhesin for platelets [Eurosta solidaginis]|uniref:serine-rich adhesin for platelets n=1 Tax=Eurosta solidaginis TaxID=178769 RepID=UPI0035307A75